jgi:peptidyl-prolyl cis-trans isomerase C
MPGFVRPTAGNSDEILATLESIAREWIFRVEFNKRNLRRQPWFAERMTSKREEFIADKMFSEMGDTCTITDDEIKKFYEDHRDDFVTLTLIKVATIAVDSQSVAEQAAKRIADGEDFASVAVDLSIYSSSPTGFDTTDLVDRSKLPTVYDAIWDKQIGEVAGPVYESGQNVWKIVKLLGREDPRLLPLNEATQMVVDRLKILKADAAVVKLIAELRSKEDVRIDYAVLEKLELPEAPKPLK